MTQNQDEKNKEYKKQEILYRRDVKGDILGCKQYPILRIRKTPNFLHKIKIDSNKHFKRRCG